MFGLRPPPHCYRRKLHAQAKVSSFSRFGAQSLHTCALAFSRAARRRCRRLARATLVEARSLGVAFSEAGISAEAPSSVSASTGLASMKSSRARPLSVIRHPPINRSTSPCEKRSRSGTRAARRRVLSAHSWPLVARMAMSRLRSAMTANPSGIADEDLEHRDLEVHAVSHFASNVAAAATIAYFSR
ncbi:hypothetical protein ACVIW0_007187 [Bradyrhizobium sp. USDA 4454]